MIRNRVMPGRRAVVASQPIAPIVARPALLRESRSRLKSPATGVHAEIAATDVHFDRRSRREEALTSFAVRMSLLTSAPTRAQCTRLTPNNAAQQTIRAVNPIVQPEAQAVHPRLVVSRGKAREELFDHVGVTVAVGIFRIQDIRRSANQRAFAPGRHAGGEREIIQEYGCFVVDAIALGIFE